MGSFTNGVYVPAIGEVGWGTNVNDFLTRSGEEYVNVKQSPYGAKGDGTTDDTAAIQAAVNALDNGSQIVGTVVFPQGTYKVSSPIVFGNGSKYVSIKVQGQSFFSASQGPLAAVILQPTSANNDAIQFNQWASHVSSLVIDGIQVQYASVGTGVGFNFAVGAQTTGPIVSNCVVQKAGVGFNIGDSVNVRLSNCQAISCDKGIKIGGGTPNLPQFDNCTVQACVTAGVSVESLVSNARFTSCVFQANTGPGLLTTGAGALQRPHFISCWWEFPGTDMIRISGITGGVALDAATFTGCVFDGSGNDRKVINVQASAASAVFGRKLTFIDCTMTNNAPNFYLLYTATDPTNSNDPGFLDITIIGDGGVLKGLHTPTSAGASHHCVFVGTMSDSAIIASSIYGTKPAYTLFRADANVVTRGDLGAIDFTEVTAPAAGATNHARLYSEDNGSGKTRLVVRFPTGAAQVIATEP